MPDLWRFAAVALDEAGTYGFQRNIFERGKKMEPIEEQPDISELIDDLGEVVERLDRQEAITLEDYHELRRQMVLALNNLLDQNIQLMGERLDLKKSNKLLSSCAASLAIKDGSLTSEFGGNA